MNPLLRRQMLDAIRLKRDTAFQEFIDVLFGLAHGSAFTSLKQKRDKGGDGIVNGDTILAAYAPESYSLAHFKKKVNGDYKSYEANWKSSHPKWTMVTNCDLLTNMVQHVDSKHPGAGKLGPVELVGIIEKLPWSTIRRIGEHLGIPSELLMNDLLGQVIDDLIRIDENGRVATTRAFALYIEDKIALNYPRDEVHRATTQYADCLEYFDSVQAILQGHPSTELRALRTRIILDCESLGGTFSQRLRGLVERYCAKSPHDDLYRFAVVVVLTFFFEQCLIGARTPGEAVC